MDRKDTHFMVFTTEEGGHFHAMPCSPEKYEEYRSTGTIQLRPGDDVPPPPADLVFVALCKIEDHFDFILGGPRQNLAGATGG